MMMEKAERVIRILVMLLGVGIAVKFFFFSDVHPEVKLDTRKIDSLDFRISTLEAKDSALALQQSEQNYQIQQSLSDINKNHQQLKNELDNRKKSDYKRIVAIWDSIARAESLR